GTATVANNRTAPLVIVEGWLTAREPGASNLSGPFDDWTPGITPQTVAPGATVALTASWVVRSNATNGTWRAHLAVKDDAGTWRDGTDTLFNVITTPPPVLPPKTPTGLRVVQVQGKRFDIGWDGDTAARTQVERSIDFAAFQVIDTVPAGTLHATTMIDRRRDYSFRVRSLNAGGFSPYSDVVRLPAK